MLVEAGGDQCGVCHPSERGFRVRQLAVNDRFSLPGGLLGGPLCLSVSSFVRVARGA
jgi:hypothetical protein